MLLTSPLVVTVGLSLTIPLSLLGQIVINGQTSSVIYWVGAAIVFLSFVFINYESKEADENQKPHQSNTSDSNDEDNLANNTNSALQRIWNKVTQLRRH